MNYYALTEKYLYNYIPLKISIENLSKEIEELDYNSVATISYEYIGSIGYRESNVENKVIKIEKKRDKLKDKILDLENKLERIDRAIEGLNEIERYIIEERYFKGKQWWVIAYKLKYSERWCKELRRRAIEKISIGLWGEEAMLHKEFTNTSP